VIRSEHGSLPHDHHTKTLEDLYNDLKRSIYSGTVNVECPTNGRRTVSKITANLKYYVEMEKKQSVATKEVYYKIGEELNNLKKIVKSKLKFKEVVKEVCNYSVSYGYKIIEFYKICNKYPKLVYTTLPFTTVKSYMKDLEDFMESDREFWQVWECLLLKKF
jgi:hypothetical protein